MREKGAISLLLALVVAFILIVLVNTLFKQNFDIREKAGYSKDLVTPLTDSNSAVPSRTSPPICQKATRCDDVKVKDAVYGGIMDGYKFYYLESGAKARLSGLTTPPRATVNWKIAQCSNGFYPECGWFLTDTCYDTVYKAPINNTGADQSVYIRGDISEYPDPWLYCPTIIFVVHPE